MTDIPDEDHVARHCRARNVDGSSVSGAEFELRLKNSPPEEYLSVNWFEKTGKATLEEQLAYIRAAIPRTLKQRDRIARLNVGESKDVVIQNVDGLLIRFAHIGGREPTYSGIFDIPLADATNKAVGIQLAIVASGNLYNAVEPSADQSGSPS